VKKDGKTKGYCDKDLLVWRTRGAAAAAGPLSLKSTHKSQASFSEFLEPSQAEVAALMTHISDGYTDTQPPGVLVVESFEWSPQKILI